MKQNNGVTLENIFNEKNGESLHDTVEIKRLFLEGSKIGKNILKKEEQLEIVKDILSSVSENDDIDKLKSNMISMLRVYETGKALENKVSYLNRTRDRITVLGACYNLVATKIASLETLKQDFETDIEGY